MKSAQIICVVPVFNDWESLFLLIKDIEQLADTNPSYEFKVFAFNDGSTQALNKPIESSVEIKIIDLAVNIGHQRAIAVGLQYVSNEVINKEQDKDEKGFIVVLDGDGEDKPSDILPMVQIAKNQIVFAKRVKRSEGRLFKTGYYFYRLIFKLLTGKNINYGNFSVIPFKLIPSVALLSNLWNHYASSIVESRIPYSDYPTERGKRYAGTSKMNTTNLIIHGFSSISIYFDRLCFRVLKFSFISILLCSVLILFVLYSKLFTDNAIPGWASSLILIALSIVVQLFSVTFIILLFQLSTRKTISPPNKELYLDFIKS
jgi:hypothetical protein